MTENYDDEDDDDDDYDDDGKKVKGKEKREDKWWRWATEKTRKREGLHYGLKIVEWYIIHRIFDYPLSLGASKRWKQHGTSESMDLGANEKA